MQGSSWLHIPIPLLKNLARIRSDSLLISTVRVQESDKIPETTHKIGMTKNTSTKSAGMFAASAKKVADFRLCMIKNQSIGSTVVIDFRPITLNHIIFCVYCSQANTLHATTLSPVNLNMTRE